MTTIPITWNEDTRPPRGGWAPGLYFGMTCRGCGRKFWGDKRAWECAECAYAKPEDATLDDEGALGLQERCGISHNSSSFSYIRSRYVIIRFPPRPAQVIPIPPVP